MFYYYGGKEATLLQVNFVQCINFLIRTKFFSIADDLWIEKRKQSAVALPIYYSNKTQQKIYRSSIVQKVCK